MNEPKLTSLETQLIRASLATKTDDQIAELLELPVEVVREKIKSIKESADVIAIQQARESKPYEFYKHKD